MSDIISILPDSVANQIAAGEVIQRPASAVKEMLENSVDAGCSKASVIIKDAGRTLIQVNDDGKGMSETDARMCFERHATSKIRSASDLLSLNTMGFRGEALASVAAVAQVELKTKRTEDELGVEISIEGSKVKSQQPCSCAKGTSIAVKNLFFNVPARRNFLKSDNVEMKHIIDEFHRVAIPHPEIAFSLYRNDAELFNMETGTLFKRILRVFGKNFNERLVPVDEKTPIVNISGFIGKPEHARKTRGEQFFFVNKRFVKNGYLHNIVQISYAGLITSEHFPAYFLFIDVDPKTIDVNIHPTKTEIKFEHEKAIFAIMRAALRRALGRHNVVPSIDFDQEGAFTIPFKPQGEVHPHAPALTINPAFNPFASPEQSRIAANTKEWQKLYETPVSKQLMADLESESQSPVSDTGKFIQIHNTYIASSIKSGLLLVAQQPAHERVLYEFFLKAMENNKGVSQKQLFPQTVQLPVQDFEIVKELENDFRSLGFDFRDLGGNTIAVDGLPVEALIHADKNDGGSMSAEKLLEEVIEQYKLNNTAMRIEARDNLARSLAKKASIKTGRGLEQPEMKNLIDRLFACETPNYAPDGDPVIAIITMEEMEKKRRCNATSVHSKYIIP